MTAPRDPDTILGAWLDDGPTRLPATTRRAVLTSVHITRQERQPRWLPWRITMHAFTRAAVAAIVLFAIVGGITLRFNFNQQSPASPLDTSSWTTYTSDRYGFSIGHPSNWSERSAIRTWTLADEADWRSPAQESFIAPDASIRVAGWSVQVPAGTTAEAWIASYCEAIKDTPCANPPTTAETVDGHPGMLVRFANDTQAFFLIGDRMYVLVAWQPESDPSAAPYGGATRLLEGYLSTMHLLPGGPGLDTSSWKTYTSDRYGFSIGHPADWSEQPSDHVWTMNDAPTIPYSKAGEHFLSATGDVGVSAWSVAVDPGTTAGAWIKGYCEVAEKSTPCADLGPATVPVTVDRHAGSLVEFAGDSTQAFILVGDRMYVVAVWRPDADPSTMSYGGSIRLLRGYVSTMHLLPGGPAVEASPTAGAPVPSPSGS